MNGVCMGEILEFTPQCHHLRWLTEHLSGWQFGEQGLLDAIGEAFDVANGLMVEYGAGDGVDLPLTLERFCVRHQQRCWLVEVEADRRESLKRIYPNAEIVDAMQWHPFDDYKIVVIDIDGLDSVVMRQMFAAGVRPTVLVVEHFDNHYPIATTKACIMPEWMLGLKLQSGHTIQDTAETLHAIALQNGYERIGFNRCNSFFVVRERYTDLFR